ncbi:uncharacterized protein LOC126671503 isoform X2 [Mercurialis annua]|uniref:uncharacterized protein LOC126671503 isoform X2 n=1 Tax=Mercurialis annua TaxID=3986 RepID=UPI00215EA0EB|nr:uncharacterized protein LOC126671503 isoform X2 [Mercurialis annua]
MATTESSTTQPTETSVMEEVKAAETLKTEELPSETKQISIAGVEEKSAVTDAPEVVEKPKEISDVPAVESEGVAVKDLKDSGAVAVKEVEKIGSPVPEVGLKLEEQSEAVKPETVQEIGKPVKDGPAKESETVGKDSEKVESDSVVAKVEEKPKEQSVVTEQVKSETVVPEIETKPEAVPEVETKLREQQSEIAEKVEPESVVPEVESKPTEQSVVTEQVKSETVVPEIETKQEAVPEVVTKPAEKQSEIVEKVEPESVIPEVESKPKEQSEVTEPIEKVEAVEAIEKQGVSSEAPPVKKPDEVSSDEHAEKPEVAVPEVEVKPVEISTGSTESVEKAGKVQDPEADVKPEEQTVVTEKVENPKVVDPEVEVKPKTDSEVAEQVELKATDEKTELSVPDVKPGSETEGAGQVEPKESIKIEAVLDEEMIRDKAEDSEGTAIPENKKEDDMKVETPTLAETIKNVTAEEKLDEPIQESQESGSAVKEEETAKTGVEEVAKSEGDDTKTSRDLPAEAPAKKQSNNILTKVKQSLVKAKKAITGKSPGSKNIASDAKDDIKVK